MKKPTFEDIKQVLNPFSETWGAFRRVSDLRQESDQQAQARRAASQIGPQNGIQLTRATLRSSDQERPDFTNRLQWLVDKIIGNHPVITGLNQFPPTLTVAQQVEAIYERILGGLESQGQRGENEGSPLVIQKTLDEVLDENLRRTDSPEQELIKKVRMVFERDHQLRFLTEEEAAKRDAEINRMLLDVLAENKQI